MELLAATLLEERLDLDTYYPEVIVRRRGKVQRGAFFPSYLFVAGDFQRVPLSAIDCTPGVVRVVRFQDEPRAVADEVLHQLRVRIDAINAAGGLPIHQFHAGDPVRITSGPLQGLEGVFDGSLSANERVTVLLCFLGGERRVVVDVEAVEPNHNSLASITEKRPRRSRGIGRPFSKNVQAGTTHPESM
jgi:transcriptional antiterminator RfaH